MKIEKSFLRGSVARRIFALFVLAAFLPMMVMAVLTFRQVRSIILEQAHSRLVATSKDFALSVNQRLILDQSILERSAQRFREGNFASGNGKQLQETLKVMYTSLEVVGPDARPASIIGSTINWPNIGETEHARLRKGESVLLVQHEPTSHPRIFLLHLIDANRPENYALLAELNQDELWGGPEDFPYMTGLCMFAADAVMLFCSQPKLESVNDLLAKNIFKSKPDAQLQIGDEIWNVGQWDLFLKPKFGSPSWTAVALQPNAVTLLPVNNFTRIFIAVILLSLLMVALLSISQIRQIMGPLEKLIKGTRRIADKDFEHRVDVVRNDEFGELAASFNDMSSRLGSQLDTLKVLSSIDRAILTKKDIHDVFEIVLARIRLLGLTGFIGIVVLEDKGDAHIYFMESGQDRNIETNRIRVNPEALQELVARDKGFWLGGAEQLRRYILQPAYEQSGQMFILPILMEGNLSAFVCLEIDNVEDMPQHTLDQVRDLGDRIGVALSASARDEQLIYQARHDDLTGLPNRLLFKERLASEISLAQRESRSLALLFIDLDRFKNINDTMGHTAGDELLKQVAQRLRHCIRESDTIARLGGDEFAIILPSIPGIRSATTLAEHILLAFSEPFKVAGQESFVTASIGIAISPADGVKGEDLLKNADTAMYRAKKLGRGRFVYYKEEMNVEEIERMMLERDIRQGLLRKEFILYYQPKLDLRTGQLAGAEALVRWNHPTRGFVSPGAFIQVAEDSGLIDELGKQVIWDACNQHAIWREAGVHVPHIAVNVSGRQFKSGDLVNIIKEALHTTSTSPEALEIEVTESLFMGNSGDATAVLDCLRDMGMKVAIDDFGTGYSSLSYLRKLPVDIMKIDKSFVDDMVSDDNARAIAKTILNLAHTLQKSVVAEGVETEEQLNLLREWKCDIIQGYYYSKPLAPDQFVEFIQAQRSAIPERSW